MICILQFIINNHNLAHSKSKSKEHANIHFWSTCTLLKTATTFLLQGREHVVAIYLLLMVQRQWSSAALILSDVIAQEGL